jgi:hypothetical protein
VLVGTAGISRRMNLPLGWPGPICLYPQWHAIDINAELSAHWKASGLLPANLCERLQAYLIHIGLDAIAYCAFRGRWDEVRSNVDVVVALTNSTPDEVALPPVIGSAAGEKANEGVRRS